MDASARMESLSNEDLLFSTRELVGRSLVVEADLIEHLGEIDERRLYLDNACPSMFVFCMKEYGFSEGAAYNRIAVARAGRKFPAVIAALRAGRVHLAGLRVLAPHFSEPNCELLLQEAAGKSKKEIEELVARIFPADPVQTSIRRVLGGSGASSAAAQQQVLVAGVPAATPRPESSPAAPSDADRGVAARDLYDTSVSRTPLPPPPNAQPRAVVAPLSGESFEIRFTASRALRDKLLEAEALPGHRVPKRNLPGVIERAIDLLIDKVKKERFGVGGRPRSPRASPDATRRDGPGGGEAAAHSRYIPEAIRRAVYERDGGCCTYVDETGRRCNSTHKVTFEHRSGFARTHVHSVDDIVVMCEAHNQHAADKMYGRAFMDRARGRIALEGARSATRPGASCGSGDASVPPSVASG